ncbi:MAG: GtrA family protein [Anaerolineales bacterium]|nr:GtrA family protein [Anaerolineales bacterium]
MEASIKNGKRINVRTEGKRFVKFLVVGTIGAVVDFGTFNLLTTAAVNLHIRFFGGAALPIYAGPWLNFPPVPSSVLSFLAAVTSNFIFNRFWTYPDSRSKPVWRQAVQFTLINTVGLAIRTPLFSALIPVWRRVLENSSPALPIGGEQASRNLALACAVLVVLVWNFVANRFWTYNDVS